MRDGCKDISHYAPGTGGWRARGGAVVSRRPFCSALATTDLLVLLSGLLVGAVEGLIGHGAALGAPLLIYFVGLHNAHLAIGASAIGVAVSAPFSLASYARSGHVKWRCGAAFTFAGFFGAVAGSTLGESSPGERLIFLFGLLMLVIAAAMSIERRSECDAAVRLDARSASRLAPLLLLAGAGVGGLSGFFGICGGFLAVPTLLATTDMPLVYAIGTSLLSLLVFSLATTANYALPGLVNWHVTALFLVGGVIGGAFGEKLARRLVSKRGELARVFPAIVAAVALFLIIETR
jgi:uncharacterized membrane protein YfcA